MLKTGITVILNHYSNAVTVTLKVMLNITRMRKTGDIVTFKVIPNHYSNAKTSVTVTL